MNYLQLLELEPKVNTSKMANIEPKEEIETIFDMAVKIVEQRVSKEQLPSSLKESNVFVLGSKGVGKSCIIYKFLEKDDNPLPTLALEYNYGRRVSENGHKQILNCWELGSLHNAEQLIEIPMLAKGLTNFTAVVVLDLSHPNRLWSDLESALQGLRSGYEKFVPQNERSIYKEKAELRVGKEHKDLATLELFPFPVIIVGGKYDLFQNFDPEIKKHVCRFLRSISHAIGSALLFYARNLVALSRSLHDTIEHLAYGTPTKPFRGTSTDYNGPLVIWFGNDSWEQIGVTPTNSERIGIAFDSQISQDKSKSDIPDDPAENPDFKEPIIDELRAQKNEELMSLLRDAEIRAKFEKI